MGGGAEERAWQVEPEGREYAGRGVCERGGASFHAPVVCLRLACNLPASSPPQSPAVTSIAWAPTVPTPSTVVNVSVTVLEDGG